MRVSLSRVLKCRRSSAASAQTGLDHSQRRSKVIGSCSFVRLRTCGALLHFTKNFVNLFFIKQEGNILFHTT